MMQSQIRAALEVRLDAFAKEEGLRVAWEGRTFKPITRQSHLRAFVMPASSDSNDLAGQHRLYRGVFQVDLVMVSGTGMGDIERKAAQVIAHFPKNLRLPVENQFVQLISVMSMGPKLPQDGFIAVPLTSYYRMDVI